MNQLTAILLTFNTVPVIAQPVITATNQPQPADVCHYLFNPDGFNYSLGPDQYWDLTGLAFISNSTAVYVLPNGTPGFVLFPTSDVALTSTFFGYEYYDMTPDAWAVLGIHDPVSGDVINCIDPLVVMPFPWTYGTSWQDPYSYTYDGETYYDTIRWQADTYGIVRLPGGTELEVVGMVEYQMDHDTVSGTTHFNEDVSLYAPGIRCKVAGFGKSWSFNPEWPPTDTNSYVRALDDATIGIAETTASEALELWPVPASGTLNLRWEGGMTNSTVQVFDAMGRVRLTATMRTMGSGGTSIDVSALASGHYVLHVNDGNRVLVRTFIVE